MAPPLSLSVLLAPAPSALPPRLPSSLVGENTARRQAGPAWAGLWRLGVAGDGRRVEGNPAATALLGQKQPAVRAKAHPAAGTALAELNRGGENARHEHAERRAPHPDKIAERHETDRHPQKGDGNAVEHEHPPLPAPQPDELVRSEWWRPHRAVAPGAEVLPRRFTELICNPPRAMRSMAPRTGSMTAAMWWALACKSMKPSVMTPT